MKLSKGLLSVVCSVTLCACATDPLRDPAFAPTQIKKILPPPVRDGGLFSENYGLVLFQDRKAYRIGDLLMVLLVERFDASKSASTSTNKTNDISIANPLVFGTPVTRGKANLSATIDSSQKFAGKGDSSQSNSISGSITVMVTDLLPNGYLMVRGEKVLTINQGDEYVRLSGIVRPVDIRTDNTILSTQLADARIIYSGRGAVANSSAHGWLAQFFLSKIWPF